MTDFDWIDYIPSDVHNGFKFMIEVDPTVFTVEMEDGDERVDVTWKDSGNNKETIQYDIDMVREFVREGFWTPVYDNNKTVI